MVSGQIVEKILKKYTKLSKVSEGGLDDKNTVYSASMIGICLHMYFCLYYFIYIRHGEPKWRKNEDSIMSGGII